MSTNDPASRAPIIGVLLVTWLAAGAGCGALARAGTVKMRGWQNPAHKGVTAGAPIRVGPVVDCSSHRADVARIDESRTWLAEEVWPRVWARTRGTGEPTVIRASRDSRLCKELYDDWFDDDGRDWNKEDGGPTLTTLATALLEGQSEQHVFVVVFGARYYCREVVRTVRDASGQPIGSIGTGKDACEENGEFDLAGYLISRDGKLVYLTNGRIAWHGFFDASDGERAAGAFVEKYPAT